MPYSINELHSQEDLEAFRKVAFSKACELVVGWISRNGLSLTLDEICAIATRLQEDYDLQKGLDDNIARIADPILHPTTEKQKPKQDLKTFAICYSEVLRRTIYVKATDSDKAMALAETYFADNPLLSEDFADSSMSSEGIDPLNDKDCDIIE